MWNTNCSFCKICICLTLSNPSAFNECTAMSIKFLASLGRIRAQEHYKVLLFSFFFFLWNEVTHASHHVNFIPTLQNASPCQRHHTWLKQLRSPTQPACTVMDFTQAVQLSVSQDAYGTPDIGTYQKKSMKTACLLFLKNFQENKARLIHLTPNKIQNIYLSFTKSMPLNSLYHLKFLGGSVRF